MLLRLWSLASLGAKPGKTEEPAGARPPPVALSWARCPPSIHDARSPAVILKLSRRTATPSATLTGAERPSCTGFATLIAPMAPVRSSRPAQNESSFGIPGSALALRPPAPADGGHRRDRSEEQTSELQ